MAITDTSETVELQQITGEYTAPSGFRFQYQALEGFTEPTGLREIQPPEGYEWRPGQQEIASFIDRLPLAVPVYLEAPTGSGKSIIALALTSMYGGLILTADHALQEQYAQHAGVGSITGMPNWPCSKEPVMADKAPCRRGLLYYSDCSYFQEGSCAYYLQRAQGLRETTAVTNYAYVLPGAHITPRHWLVGDEAHQAEQIVRSWAAATLPIKPLWNGSDLNRSAVAYTSQVVDLIVKTRDAIFQMTETLDRPEPPTEAELLHLNLLKDQLDRVNRVDAMMSLSNILHMDMLFVEMTNGMRFTPLVGPYDQVLRGRLGGARRLYMSATIGDPWLTGAEGNAVVIRMPSQFDRAHRPIVPMNVAKISAKSTDQDYQVLARTIDRLMIQHGHTKGVVHCVSYQLAETIKQLSQFPSMMITHQSGGRDDAIERFREAPPGRVLLSPAVATGVDLPYDLCRWQAIAKLPFPYMGDPLTKARVQRFPELGNCDTASAIVQMAGRGMRAQDDSCVTYILDANWRWFYTANRRFFPLWFQEAVTSRLL